MTSRKAVLSLFVAVLVTCNVVYVTGRMAVAWAVARAPNHGLEELPKPSPPADLLVESLEVPVGPPRASLSAWIVAPSVPSRGTVLVLHGIRRDKSDMLPIARALAGAGFRAALVDLRGHGASTGDYLTYGIVESADLRTVLDALASRFDVGRVGAWGYSYGGAVAIQLAARDPRISAVVAVAAFSTLRDAVDDYAQRYLPAAQLIPVSWIQAGVDWAGALGGFVPDAASPLHAAARVGPRLLVAHGDSDEQTTPRHGRLLALAAGSGARRLTIHGAGHGAVANDPTVVREGLSWLERHIKP